MKLIKLADGFEFLKEIRTGRCLLAYPVVVNGETTTILATGSEYVELMLAK